MATKELTTGNPFKLIILFMFPIFIGNLFQQFYHFVDTLIVGRVIGIEALAAVGVTGPLIFFVISFIFAATQGFSVITAQKFGAKEYDLLRKSFAASIILSALLTIVITLISVPFTKQMLIFLQTPENILQGADDYLFIMFAGIIATIFYNLSSNIVRALGDSKTPLYFLIVSTILNLIMDVLFVIKFGWGIKGVGWATIVAQAISTILCVWYMLRKFPILKLSRDDWKIPFSFLYEHLRVGIPMGIQMSVLSLGIIALQYVLNTFGATAIAAFTTACRIEQIFLQLFLALGATMAVYTAQNFGAKKLSRIKEGVKKSIYIALIIYVFSMICIWAFSTEMVSWFITETNEELIFLANQYLYIIMGFFIFLGLLMIFRNVLQGMGSVMAPLSSGIAELIARTVCAFSLGYLFGYKGVCYATPMAWLAAAIVLYVGYKMSLKKQLSILKNK